MKAIASAFLNEPVLILGVLATAATVLVSEGVITGWIGILAVAVITVIQRHFVQPNQT